MDRYSCCMKYLVLALALLHPMSGGHMVCHAHSHLVRFVQHEHRVQHGHHCDQHPSPGIQQPACCQDCPYNYKHVCNGQLAARTFRSVDEAEQLISVATSAGVSFLPVMVLPVLRDAVAACPSVCVLRLHLFYGVLLI